jgi:hypothetical protein
MARGFDSKSVSDQQEEMERRRDPAPPRPTWSPRRRSLELARSDLQRRMAAVPEPHRPRLQLALDEIERQLAAIPDPTAGTEEGS